MKSNYKKILAALPLDLHTLIAKAVLNWRRLGVKENTCKTEKHFLVVAKSSHDADYKICSHHYAVTIDDVIAFCFITVPFPVSYRTVQTVNNIITPGYCHANKGPPAVFNILSCI